METFIVHVWTSAEGEDGAGPLRGRVEHPSTGRSRRVTTSGDLRSFLDATAGDRTALVVAELGRPTALSAV
jgi:hypothetical protein